jgi:hypothetical protein
VEPRYLGPFVVLLWIGAFSAARLPGGEDMKRIAAAVTVAVTAFLMLEVAALAAHDFYHRGRALASHPQWQIASALHGLGIQRGDRVGFIGWGPEAYWARLARVRIVAEIPPDHAGYFWAGDDGVRSRAIQAFARSGAKAIVAEKLPAFAPAAGWRPLNAPGYHAYLLEPQSAPRDGLAQKRLAPDLQDQKSPQ